MKLNESNFFKTSEFILICALVHNGVTVERFEPDPINPRRAVAVFVVSKELESLRGGLYQGNLLVEPVAFWEVARGVKEQIRAALGQGRWN